MINTYITLKIYNTNDDNFLKYQFTIFFDNYGVIMIKNINFVEQGVFCLTMNKNTFNQNFYIK